MTIGVRSDRIEWRRAARTLTTTIVDIDIALSGVVLQEDDARFGSRAPSPVDYAIEGFVRPPAAAADGGPPNPSVVYVSGYRTSDRLDRDEDFDPRSVSYIAIEAGPDQAQRTSIIIEAFIFRRLVELYATRRIDAARLSILLKVFRGASGEIEIPALVAPPLKSAVGLHSRHSRGHLMSVETALSGGTRFRPLFQSSARARAARRQDVVPGLLST